MSPYSIPAGDIAPGMSREWRRAKCEEVDHMWTIFGVPVGTMRCRRCARWESTDEEVDEAA